MDLEYVTVGLVIFLTGLASTLAREYAHEPQRCRYVAGAVFGTSILVIMSSYNYYFQQMSLSEAALRALGVAVLTVTYFFWGLYVWRRETVQQTK